MDALDDKHQFQRQSGEGRVGVGKRSLIITLANTREVLYLVNRPGNAVSHEGVCPLDRSSH